MTSKAPKAELNPTEAPDGDWLYAERKKGAYPKETARCGKWLIFIPVEKVDEVWKTVRLATEKGQLGGRSRVSTGRGPASKGEDPNARVIAVYTYDWKDKKDVMRVRDKLKQLGFSKALNYKTQADTAAGKYYETDSYHLNKFTV
jgi:hypothetical protein